MMKNEVLPGSRATRMPGSQPVFVSIRRESLGRLPRWQSYGGGGGQPGLSSSA